MKGTGIEKSTFRTVVVPTEHGGWGFTLEPVLLGTLVAPGTPAIALAVAAFATFLARRPLRIAVADFRRDRRLARTDVATSAVVGLGIIAALGLGLAAVAASNPFWWPLLIAIPIGVIQLRFDLDSRGRELLPELLGPIALGAAAPMIILAEGLTWRIALGAWVVLAARVVPSVLVVRAQLRKAKQQPFSATPAAAAGAAAVVVVAGTGWIDWAPWLSTVAAGLSAGWDWISIRQPPVPAKTLGWTQMVVGLVVVTCFAAGYHLGW